jgi:hypothetical protein
MAQPPQPPTDSLWRWCGVGCACVFGQAALGLWLVEYLTEDHVLTLRPVLLVVAILCFLLAALNVSSRINLTAAGLACYVLSLLVA